MFLRSFFFVVFKILFSVKICERNGIIKEAGEIRFIEPRRLFLGGGICISIYHCLRHFGRVVEKTSQLSPNNFFFFFY